MKPGGPNCLKPDYEHYDRALKDCIVYAWLLFGDDELGGDMFLLGPFEVVHWEWKDAWKCGIRNESINWSKRRASFLETLSRYTSSSPSTEERQGS